MLIQLPCVQLAACPSQNPSSGLMPKGLLQLRCLVLLQRTPARRRQSTGASRFDALQNHVPVEDLSPVQSCDVVSTAVVDALFTLSSCATAVACATGNMYLCTMHVSFVIVPWLFRSTSPVSRRRERFMGVKGKGAMFAAAQDPACRRFDHKTRV